MLFCCYSQVVKSMQTTNIVEANVASRVVDFQEVYCWIKQPAKQTLFSFFFVFVYVYLYVSSLCYETLVTLMKILVFFFYKYFLPVIV